MKKVLYTIFLLTAGATPLKSQDAFVQVIHACADTQADSVDVYVNDALTLDNFAHRTATKFLKLPATSYQIKIAGKNSKSASEFVYQSPSLTLQSGKYYTIVAAGVLSGPGKPFALHVSETRNAAVQSSNTDVLVFHGSADAPHVDVTTGGGGSTLLNNLEFGQFGQYLELPLGDYTTEVRDSSGKNVVASYEAPLKTLGLGSKAVTVVADGFLSPGSGQDGFGLFAVVPDGGDFVALPVSKAKVQIIHNSPNADSVDIYLNGAKILNNFPFRTATGFVEVKAGTVQSIAVAPKTSGSASDAIATIPLTFEANKSYVAIASGIVGGSGDTAFKLIAYAPAREKSRLTGKTDVLIFHGSTNAPAVDVVVTGTSTVLADNLEYGKFNSVGYLELDPLNYSIDIVPAAGGNAVASYSAPLQTLNLGNAALTVIASGYLNPGTGKPAFGLFVAPAAQGPLLALPLNPNASSKSVEANTIKIWPVPAANILNIQSVDQMQKIAVISTVGQTILETAVNRKSQQLSLGNLRTGVYMLQITTDKGIVTKQFIVE